MSQSFILVEGVNIYANVLDTNQLSVIRGTSFLLKDAIEALGRKFENYLEPISTGASSGLYRVKNQEKESHNAQTLLTEISNFLNTPKPKQPFHLLSFIAETCEAETLLEAKEILLTRLRMRQMRSLIAVPDQQNNNNLLAQPDQLEGKRIACRDHHKKIQGDKKRYLSESVYQRWNYGRKKKFDFYFDKNTIQLIKAEGGENAEAIDSVIKNIEEKGFYNDFEALAKHPNESHRLNNKLAVIYLDGNSFSKKQKNYLSLYNNLDEQLKAQRKFDTKIQGYRANFIYQHLKKYYAQEEAQNGDKIRLETLLWGGDEMLFVVPAWQGFDLLQFFFEQSKDWHLDIDDNKLDDTDKQLTHAAGLVFCHAKTPIRHIRGLAQAIAEKIKESPHGRQQNAWSYQILESIDYPSNNDISDFNRAYYGEKLANTKPDFIPVNFERNSSMQWSQIKEILSTLIQQGTLPKSQLYQLLDTIRNETMQANEAMQANQGISWNDLSNASTEDQQFMSKINQQELRLLSVSSNKNQLVQDLPKIATFFGIEIENAEKRIWLWIYLYEIWDYLDLALDSEKRRV